MDNRKLLAVNQALANHPVEQVAATLRGYMTAMNQIAVGGLSLALVTKRGLPHAEGAPFLLRRRRGHSSIRSNKSPLMQFCAKSTHMSGDEEAALNSVIATACPRSQLQRQVPGSNVSSEQLATSPP